VEVIHLNPSRPPTTKKTRLRNGDGFIFSGIKADPIDKKTKKSLKNIFDQKPERAILGSQPNKNYQECGEGSGPKIRRQLALIGKVPHPARKGR
jgi:hypothetical protein